MVQLELPLKMLDFTIEAIEYRIAAYERAIASGSTSEDEIADMGNDKMVLHCALDYLKAEADAFRETP
jgi:hypothetical protein